MRVIALDTASAQLVLAAAHVDGGALCDIVTADAPAPRKANQVLLERLSGLLETAGWKRADIDAVVVGRGPGSFTGVRIGVATAKGLACGLGVALYGASTLDACAWRAWRHGVRGYIGVVADAMRKEVYPVRYNLTGAGVARLDVDAVAAPADVARAWEESGTPLTLLGDGLAKHAAAFENDLFTLAPQELWLPDARGLVEAFLASVRADEQGTGDAATLLPVYTRLSDAEENERARLKVADHSVPEGGVAGKFAEGGVLVSPMSLNDASEAAQLQAQALPQEAWSERTLADEIGRPDRTWWVARKEGRLVGCAGGHVIDAELNVLIVCVDERFRHEGIATRLLERVATDGRALGAERIVLEVRTDNENAIALYHELGLEDVGVRPRFYRGTDDALIMRGPLPLATVSRRIQSAVRIAKPHAQDEGPGAKDAARPLILAIESSCDETAAAVVDGTCHVLADTIASQIDFHARFGGVVPEIASRKHAEAIVPTVMCTLEQAGVGLSDLSAIAVTQGPGLVGALVVGLAFAKGLSFAADLPLICVNHLEGHLYANRYVQAGIEPPFVALLVSGGHTMLVHVKAWGSYEVLGSTLDDAVGEAFDKVAKALGLGYPGGPIISRLAAEGNPRAIDFPRAMLHSGDLRFSLSGLKTAVITYINRQNDAGMRIDFSDLAASFQAAVIDVLIAKALDACKRCEVSTLCVGGGVAANPELRFQLAEKLGRKGIHVVMPELADCTDNASMIGAVALDLYAEGAFAALDADPMAHMPLRGE